MERRNKEIKIKTGYNLISLSHQFGKEIFKSIKKYDIRFFKSYQLRPKTGLTKQQFNLGVRWLKENGYIEKTGGPYSCWRVLERES